MATQVLCTFVVGGEWFGVEADRVQEVLRIPEVTPVPNSSRAISGLMNLRGDIVLVLDLGWRLGLPGGSKGKSQGLLIRREGGPLCLKVDEVGSVVEMDDKSFEGNPGTLTGEARRLLKGAYKMDDRLLLLLEVDRAVRLDDDTEGEGAP